MPNLNRFIPLVSILLLILAFSSIPALPDLAPMKILDLDIYYDEDENEVLGFASAIMNIGEGPLEVHSAQNLVRGQSTDSSSVATQYIYDKFGNLDSKVQIGVFVYHAHHNHWHLVNVEKYSVYEAADDGHGGVFGKNTGLGHQKVSFCLRDSAKVNPNFQTKRTYRKCTGKVQGISAGFTDLYDYYLDGQYFKSRSLRSGKVYYVVNEVNPGRSITEENYDNNLQWASFVLRRTRRGRVLEIKATSKCDFIEGGCGEYINVDNLERP